MVTSGCVFVSALWRQQLQSRCSGSKRLWGLPGAALRSVPRIRRPPQLLRRNQCGTSCSAGNISLEQYTWRDGSAGASVGRRAPLERKGEGPGAPQTSVGYRRQAHMPHAATGEAACGGSSSCAEQLVEASVSGTCSRPPERRVALLCTHLRQHQDPVSGIAWVQVYSG